MPPAAAIGGALVGGVAGAFGKNSSQSTVSSVDAGPATAFENLGQQGWQNAFQQLGGMVNAGPGRQDVTNVYQAQKDLASTYQQYANGGFLPNAQDNATANNFAAAQFAPQQAQLNQTFLDQTQQANRAAAAMGASANDPILAAKLRTAQSQQQTLLNAQQGAFGSQMAMQMPGQRLGYQQAYAGALSGLATQAMANRQALAAMGEGIMQNQQNYRLQTATRTSNHNTSSGGGIGGAITGAIGGAGMGMSAYSSFANLGGGSPVRSAPTGNPFGLNGPAFQGFSPGYTAGSGGPLYK